MGDRWRKMIESFPSLRASIHLPEDWEEPVNSNLFGCNGHLHLVWVKESEGVWYCMTLRHKVIHSHGGFELAVNRLVLYCRLLLTCSFISLIIVPLDVGYCTLHSIYLSKWLYILDTVNPTINLLFSLCNNSAFGVMMPTRATVSP